jgi:hypothetical protein
MSTAGKSEHPIARRNIRKLRVQGMLMLQLQLRILQEASLYLITNSVALVRERTIPTERSPLVDEVSTNFCR